MTDQLKSSVSTLSSSTDSEPKDEEEIMPERNLKMRRSSSWAYWNCFIPPKTPDSPSPVVSRLSADSPEELPISSATSERLSPVSTEFWTPYNQRSSSNIYNEGSKSLMAEGFCSTDGGTVNRDSYQKKKQILKGKSVRTFGKLHHSCEPSTGGMRKSSELNNPRSSIQPLLNVSHDVPAALRIHNEQEEITGDQRSIEDGIVSTVGNSDNDEQQSNPAAPQPGERYFHKFISGIRRGKVEMKLDEWRREAMSTKLKDRLRKKEASIDEWERKEIARASTDLNEFEHKLERQKVEAMVKMQKKIENTQRKAELKKEKERQSTAMKTTKVPRVVDKISVVGRLSWWRSLLNP